jgi:hypothetical protein
MDGRLPMQDVARFRIGRIRSAATGSLVFKELYAWAARGSQSGDPQPRALNMIQISCSMP